MTMYYTGNTIFMHYVDNFKEQLEISSLDVNQKLDNTGTDPSNFPTVNPFDNKLLKAPDTEGTGTTI